jgi:photosystem II stability/assembly factor-like uncharacterized protein
MLKRLSHPRKSALAFIALIYLVLGPAASGIYCMDWISCNGPVGRYDSVRTFLDPQDPAILYAEANGLIHKSTDGGETWNLTGSSDTGISLLAISSQYPDTLYGSVEEDLFMSTDGGINWSHLEEFYADITALAIDPQNPGIMYAGTESGAFKSTDGGENWSFINNGLTNYRIRVVSIDPQNSATLYAGTYDGDVYRSTNGGENWSLVDKGLPDSEVFTLSIDPKNQAILYASFYRGELYKSTDSGENWHLLESPRTFDSLTFAINPQDTAILYAGLPNSNMAKSTDGGTTWEISRIWGGTYTIRGLLINPQNPEIVYASSNAVYKSTNGGAAWSASGLTSLRITSLAIDPQNPDTLYAGTRDDGLFKSTRGCSGFKPSVISLYFSGSVNALAIDPQSPATVYAGTSNGLYKSTDGGATWIYRASINHEVHFILINPQNPEVLYVGTWYGVHKSIDGGASWIDANSGLSDLFTSTLAMDPDNPQILYAGVDQGVFKTIDGGANWISAGSGLTGFSGRALAVDPSNPDILYAGGLFKSTDGGFSWSPSGLTNAEVQALAINPENPRTLYAAAYQGFFESTDGGDTWGGELNEMPLHSLAINPSMPQTIYVGTDTSGVFVSSTQQAPPPNLMNLSPRMATAGDDELWLSVYGNRFTSDSVVLWNGSEVDTGLYSPTHLRAIVPADLLSSPGTASIVASSGGIVTNSLDFSINPYSPVTVTFNTYPLGLAYNIDGHSCYDGQQSFSWAVGSRHRVSSPTFHDYGLTAYSFTNWSNGGAPDHFIDAPASSTTYTARYDTLYKLIKSVSPQNGGSIAAGPAPPDGRFYASGTSVRLLAIANSGYSFVGWSGDLTGSTNPQTVTMSAPHTITASFAPLSSIIRSITITTNPIGRIFMVDGTAYATTKAFSWTQGSSHTISVATSQELGETRYVFANWSDGGAILHTISVPAEATTYIANFTARYRLTASVSPQNGGIIGVSPASPDGYYASGTSVMILAIANGGYSFAAWSGDATGTANQRTVTMSVPRNVIAQFRFVGTTPSRRPSQSPRRAPIRRDRKYLRD